MTMTMGMDFETTTERTAVMCTCCHRMQDAGYAQTDSGDDESDQPDFDQAGYMPGYAQPGYFEPPMMDEGYAPRMPTPVTRYATSADPPIRIPAGAKVTKGSVYKSTKNGVNAYTDNPSPDSTGSKLLFAYTEVVTPAPTLAR